MAIKTWPAEVNSVLQSNTWFPLDEITLPEKIFIVPGAHLDFGWCAGISECLAYADEIIKGSIDAITGPVPDYRFTVEYAAFLRHFLARFPEYLPTVKQLVKERKIETTAAMVGYMEDVLDGEIMVREIVHAKRFARDVLDCDLPTAQHSDLPGHTPQMPQLLAKAGVKYFSYTSAFDHIRPSTGGRPPTVRGCWRPITSITTAGPSSSRTRRSAGCQIMRAMSLNCSRFRRRCAFGRCPCCS